MFRIKHAKAESHKIIFYRLGNLKETSVYFLLFTGVIFAILSIITLTDDSEFSVSFLLFFAIVVFPLPLLLYIAGQLKIIIDKKSESVYYQFLGVKKHITYTSNICNAEEINHPVQKWKQYYLTIRTSTKTKILKLTHEFDIPNISTEQAYDTLLQFISSHPVQELKDADKILVFKESESGIYEYKYFTYGTLSGCLVVAIIPVFLIGLFFCKYLFVLYIPMFVYFFKTRNRILIDLNRKEISISIDEGRINQTISFDMIYKIESIERKNLKGWYLCTDSYLHLNNGNAIQILDLPIGDAGGAILHDIKLLINKKNIS